MVHEGLQERVRDREHPAPLVSPSWYGAEDRRPTRLEVVRHRTSPRRAAAIAALTLVATSVAPVRAQTRYYVLFPDNHQPAAAQNVVTFSGGSPSSSYSVRMAQTGDTPSSPADSLLNVEFFQGNQRIRVTPQAVTPTAFAAVYDDDGAVGTDTEVDAGVYEGASTTASLLFIVSVRYDASARFTDGQLIGDQRWGTPRIEVYEGATADPALAFAWVAHGAGTRTWSTGDPGTAYRCKVGGEDVTFATWPASPGEDSALFTVTPATTSGSSGSGIVSFNAAPDYETPTDSGGDNLYKVRVGNGHSLNDIFGEGLRTGCTGSGLDLEILVKDAGPPAPVRMLTGDLDSNAMTISVTWTPPAGFLDGSDSNVVVPFDAARRSGSGNPGTAVAGYDYEYRLEGSSTWTQETTTSTSFEIPGVGADDAYRVRVRARNAEGAGAFTTIDVPRLLEPETPEPETPKPSNQRPSVSASCDPCTVVPGGEVRLTATASDPDGDDLTYAWSAAEGVFRGGTDAATARWTAPEATGPVRFRVRVSDGHGGSASATVTVTVEVTNQPPEFESTRYAFELRENIDGSRRPVDLGTVAAPDPDGDEVTYELAVGDRSRFTVGARDGIVRYVGPGEDFESKPNLYKLSVHARDPHRAAVKVRVTVTVVNVNEAPEPEDDDAATDEDVVVTVDVLANDTDPDGDRLRVESVSAPAHGTTSVAGGGVRYTPELNYHGKDRFTYVVSDGNGETAEAAVEVTVLPVNDAPEAVGAIPDQALDEGGGETTVELTPFFDDVDGDALAYRASSSDPSVAMAAVSGAVLTLAPVEYGSATVTVTAEDEGGLSATQAFVVGVSDRLVRGVVSETLAGMARSHLASARMTLGRRVTAGRTEAPRRCFSSSSAATMCSSSTVAALTVLGRRVPLGQAAARTAAEQLVSGWLSSWATPRGGLAGAPAHGAGAAAGFSEPAMGPVSMSGMPAATGPGGMAGVGRGSSGSLGGLGSLGGFGGGRDPLRGSEFLLALGGRQDAAEGSDPAGRWQMWGQGDIQAFEGAPSTATGYEGELQTGYVGMDRWLTERWLVRWKTDPSRGGGHDG